MTPPPPSITGVRQPSPVPLATGLFLLLFAAFSHGTLNDGDTFSHVRTGLWILQQHAVPHTDIFSYTLHGAPWTPHEWLAEVLFALAFQVAGWAGVLALTAGCAGAAGYLLSRALARGLQGPALLAASGMGAMSCMSGLLARPHLLALPIVILWIDRLITARRSDTGPVTIWMGSLMLLWANLHGGWAFGLVLLGLFATERMVSAPGNLRDRWIASRNWWYAVASATLASAATPNGMEGVLFPVRLSLIPNLSMVREWQSADFSVLSPLELIVLAGMGLGLSGRVRLDGFSTLLLLALAHMALQHRRHEALLAVSGVLLMADAVASRSRSTPAPADRYGTLVFVSAASAALLLRLCLPIALADSQVAAPSAIAHVPPQVRSRPVFNSYEFGGFLIFSGIAPYIDGRADMFGPRFLNDYVVLLSPDPDRFRTVVERYGIGWTLLRPGEPLVKMLDRTCGWHRIHSDNTAVVHVRDPADTACGQP